MKQIQISLEQAGFEKARLKSRKRVMLEQMNAVVPWRDLVALIEPHRASGAGPKGGRPPFATEMLLRLHLLQHWFGLSDLGLQEALHDVPLYRKFAGLDAGEARIPDESTILRFRHLLERHQLAQAMFEHVNAKLLAMGLMLKEGSVIDATIIAAPSSTKNNQGARDPEMHQTKKGNQWHFGMNAHIGVDAGSGLIHTTIATAANVHDVTQAHALVREGDELALGDAGYQGTDKREDTQQLKAQWEVAMRAGKRKLLDLATPLGRMMEQLEQIKASVRAQVEHPFKAFKCDMGWRKLAYRGVFKNGQKLCTMSMLFNLKHVRHRILQVGWA